MSNEKYLQFEKNMNTLQEHLRKMQSEAEKTQSQRDQEIFLDGYAAGSRAIGEIGSYYNSLAMESTLAQTIKVKLEEAERQFKEIEKIVSQNGFKITPRKSSIASEPKRTSEESFRSILKEASELFNPIKRKESSATNMRTSAEKEEKISETWEELMKSPFEENTGQQLDQKSKPEENLSESYNTLLKDLHTKVNENKIGFTDLDNLQKLAAIDTTNLSEGIQDDITANLMLASIQLQIFAEDKPLLTEKSESELRRLKETLTKINEKLGSGNYFNDLDSAIFGKFMDNYNASKDAQQAKLAEASISAKKIAGDIILKKQTKDNFLKTIFPAGQNGKLDEKSLNDYLSGKTSTEKLDLLETAFSTIRDNKVPGHQYQYKNKGGKYFKKKNPLTNTQINNIAALKKEYLKAVVTSVQMGENVDLNKAASSELVDFRNSNLPLPKSLRQKNTDTREAMNYLNRNIDNIKTISLDRTKIDNIWSILTSDKISNDTSKSRILDIVTYNIDTSDSRLNVLYNFQNEYQKNKNEFNSAIQKRDDLIEKIRSQIAEIKKLDSAHEKFETQFKDKADLLHKDIANLRALMTSNSGDYKSHINEEWKSYREQFPSVSESIISDRENRQKQAENLENKYANISTELRTIFDIPVKPDTEVKYFNSTGAPISSLQVNIGMNTHRDNTPSDSYTVRQENIGFTGYQTVGLSKADGGKYIAQEDRIVHGELKAAENLSELQIKTILQNTFAEAEKTSGSADEKAGSTLVTSIIQGNTIYTAHVGDSQGFLVLQNKDGNFTVERLNTRLHDPDDPEEKARVGEKNIYNGRLEFKGGTIAVTRAIGDHHVGEKMSHEPDIEIKKVEIPEGGKAFVLHGCDGLVEALKYANFEPQKQKEFAQEILHKQGETVENYIAQMADYRGKNDVQYLTQLLNQHKNQPLEKIPELLGQDVMRHGSGDNISITVAEVRDDLPTRFVGVADGHGGQAVSESIRQTFPSIISEQARLANSNLYLLNSNSTRFYEQANKAANGQLPQNNRSENLIKRGAATEEEIAHDAKSTHPILHTEVRQLIIDFLEHKKANGSEIEQKFYKEQNMSPEQFVQRLITQRPLMFMGAHDEYILRDGTRGISGFENGQFEKIGTANESPPLTLKNYISYDEMQISALLGVSSSTHFINKGERTNAGKLGKEGEYEKTGIYAGLVGARFEKPGLMDYQHMVVTKTQNTTENGYGWNGDKKKAANMAHFAKLYGEPYFPSFEEAERAYNANPNGQYLKITLNNDPDNVIYFNKDVYKARMRLVIEPFLDDANQLAGEQNKKAYIHAVGLGMGVWANIHGQSCKTELEKLQVEVYAELLKENKYSNISDINFSWFSETSKEHLNSSKIGDTNIIFSKRNPADVLKGEDGGKLLVAQYAWDGNSHTGNEIYAGKLTDSGEPGAVCSSTIGESQNPIINPQFTSRCKLSGEDKSYEKAAKASDKDFENTVAEYSKLPPPPRPTQALPALNPKEQETVHNIESKIGNAMKDLEFASGDLAKMTPVLNNIRTLRSEIHELKSKPENQQIQEKLAISDNKLKTAINEIYEKHKKVDNADVGKSKPVESKPQIIEATSESKPSEQVQKDKSYQTPTLGIGHK